MNQRVVIITTGGTIAMRYDSAKGGSIPAVNGKELIEAIPTLSGLCPLEVVEFANIPSFSMTPALMWKLAHVVEEHLARSDVGGVVITHGTDTLEETAYFLDLYLTSEKPVCLTGAMRTTDDMNPDGAYNIVSAVRTACAPDACGCGVLVVMNGEIHAACTVTKTHTANVATFASPSWGALGSVDDDRIVMMHIPRKRQNIRPATLPAKVPILKLYTGMDGVFFDMLTEHRPDGLVIEGFGRGNVPDTALPGIRCLLDRNIPIVATSRVWNGRVLGVYAVEGGAGYLNKIGVILGDELSSHKARLKLMLALGVTRDPAQVRTFFA